MRFRSTCIARTARTASWSGDGAPRSGARELVGSEVLSRDFTVESEPDLVALDPRDLGGGAEMAALQQNIALGELAAFENDLGALARKIANADALRAAAGHEARDH